MKRTSVLFALVAASAAAWCCAVEPEKNVPSRAAAEIARRGPLVERVGGLEVAATPTAEIAAAMQPPADDSYKWHFTLVTTRNCQWCAQARRDFEHDQKLKAWVDPKDYTKSWGHWQVVQIEDQSQAWRWKDFRPTAFPALIVQPPVNGSWGDPHTIVFARQGYLKPAELDAAIRQAIQRYAAKVGPRNATPSTALAAAGQAPTSSGHEQARSGEAPASWTPPVTPPQPLPPTPAVPNYPSVPPQYPPAQPDLGSLLGQLLASLFTGTATANLLLLAILVWQVYRGIAKRQGIPLLVNDATAARLIQLLESLPGVHSHQPAPPARPASTQAASGHHPVP